jgi:hypothetical protein
MPIISTTPISVLSIAEALSDGQASRNRTIILAQNKRHGLRGVSHINNQEFMAFQEDDDDLTYVFDLSAYIEGANITQVARVPNGNTLTGVFHTTTRIAQRLKGFGRLDIRASLDTGDTEQFFLNIVPRSSSARATRYAA